MNEQNKDQKNETGDCGPGCNCGTSGSGGRGRWILGIVILLIAGVLLARAVMKEKGTQVAPASTGFAALDASAQAPEPAEESKSAKTNILKVVTGLSELNEVAADKFGVFVFLPGNGETSGAPPIEQMRSAARTIEPQLNGGTIGMFALKVESPDYKQIALQMSVPGVLAMVKGKGMSATSGDITEAKLVQALVAASSAGGCGPTPASGCCP